MENAVRPESDLAITDSPREGNAFIHEAAADAQATRRRLDVEQPQSGDSLRILHTENRANDFSVTLSDPASLPLGVEALEEFRGDFRYERLESLIPPILLIVEDPLTVGDPADVSGLWRPNDIRHLRSVALSEERFDRMHRVKKLLSLAG